MTASDGLWKSTDIGRSFKKISTRRFAWVDFLDSQHGFAVGSDARQIGFVQSETVMIPLSATMPRGSPVERTPEETRVPTQQLMETMDGGVKWKVHPVSKEVKGAYFRTIEFAGQSGVVMGMIYRRVALPSAASTSAVTVIAETGDGGRAWKVSHLNLPGQTRIYRAAPGGGGYALVWPGEGMARELYRIEAGQTGATRVFADPSLFANGLAVRGDASVWLATVVRRPGVAITPAGTEVKMLYSANGSDFKEIAVRPKVTANGVVITSAPGGTMWAATDTGIILKLEED